MKRILVVANETVAGRPLIDAVKRRAGDDDDVRVHVICPQNEPKHGFVVHDEHIRDAAAEPARDDARAAPRGRHRGHR